MNKFDAPGFAALDGDSGLGHFKLFGDQLNHGSVSLAVFGWRFHFRKSGAILELS